MREPLLRFFSEKSSPGDSWLNRVRENLAQLLIPSHFMPTSANGAPIHLLQFDKTKRPARAQGVSLITHVAVFAGLAFLLAQSPRGGKTTIPPGLTSNGTVPFPSALLRGLRGPSPSDGKGRGGDENPLPAKRGNLPPFSSVVLVKPTLPPNETSRLAVHPTLLDPSAEPILKPTLNIGLPWMPTDTNSPGPGKGQTIGSKDDNTLGDSDDGPAGRGYVENAYRPGVTEPICNYCPYPTYTDDARHAKVQGTVTLQVLVGADGRAQQIRVVKGLGFGLDDRAVESVRTWKFVPARDAARRSGPAWVTVEAVFRLF
jgi:periplasmic protein TonB